MIISGVWKNLSQSAISGATFTNITTYRRHYLESLYTFILPVSLGSLGDVAYCVHHCTIASGQDVCVTGGNILICVECHDSFCLIVARDAIDEGIREFI